jgi:hypothetical protein
MVGSDGGCDIGRSRADELYRLRCGDMFQHNFQCGKTGGERVEYPLDENCLAVKNINLAIGYLAMYQEWYSGFLHGSEGVIEQAQIGYARVGVGGGPGRIELHGLHKSAFGALRGCRLRWCCR